MVFRISRKKIFFVLMLFCLLTAEAQSARSGFVDGFSIDRYEKKTLGDAYETAKRSYERGISGEHFKSYCHFISQFDWSNGGTQGRFYCDDSYLSGDFTKGVPFPKDIPPFTSLEVYYHFEAPYYAIFPYIDGWCVVDDTRFIGQKYIATDALKIRESPSLSAKQIGRLLKGARATVIEVGEDVTIDGIESAWVKVRTKDGVEGWCFAGYLTDSTEYRKKPWKSDDKAEKSK